MVGYQQYHDEEVPQEKEMGIDTSTNYITNQPYEVHFNFPLNYDPENALRRPVSIFDKLSVGYPEIGELNTLFSLKIDVTCSQARNANEVSLQ